MQITEQAVDIRVDGSTMRMRVVLPKGSARRPAVLFYSEIFQITGPIRRAMDRLAGHGYVVGAPEIFHRVEAPGAVVPYDDAGRDRGMSDAKRTAVAEHDRDRAAALDWLATHRRVLPDRLGAMGFCIGGHLALRAALDGRVRATVACYPTGVHSGALGSDADAGTLDALKSIEGEALVVYGAADPHVPPEGRAQVAAALVPLGARARLLQVPEAEHAFMRDEGARYDAAAADMVWGEALAFFRRALVDGAG